MSIRTLYKLQISLLNMVRAYLTVLIRTSIKMQIIEYGNTPILQWQCVLQLNCILLNIFTRLIYSVNLHFKEIADKLIWLRSYFKVSIRPSIKMQIIEYGTPLFYSVNTQFNEILEINLYINAPILKCQPALQLKFR